MATTVTDYAPAINELIAVCKDAEQGFTGAAAAVETNPTLQSTFEEYARQRANFAQELQFSMKHFGNDPDDPSGLAGKLHSAWITLKGAVTGYSEHQILVETERGEDITVDLYRRALGKVMPIELQAIVEQQYEMVQQAHNHIRNLRDRTE